MSRWARTPAVASPTSWQQAVVVKPRRRSSVANTSRARVGAVAQAGVLAAHCSAASSKVAATVAPRVDVADLQPVDVVVVGSVAVNRDGVRIGKGLGIRTLSSRS
ncbi:5-formyltetrahydrofolate cyclo-ligase [Streptomyces sp. PSKA30]|uniref:5-formyltetrahydrofolate cyclo-ligase n=1 Tax=Streptomyces sp. PSKA30 TaxID=2874597 RepID=UPI0027E19FF2|nr:5-formyltetrahydrofolate cyclo-ligase [Streptomyces sp. PSKA30]